MMNESENYKITGVMVVQGDQIDEEFWKTEVASNLMANKTNLEKEQSKLWFNSIWDENLIQQYDDEKVLIYI